MKTGFILLAALVFLAGCRKDQGNCAPAREYYRLFENSALDTSGTAATDFAIVQGNARVFEYRLDYAQCKGLLGAPVSRIIAFQIPPATAAGSFTISDSASLRAARAFIKVNAPSPYYLYPKFFTSGTIEGSKKSATEWRIRATLFSPFNGETFQIDTDFVLAN